MYQMLYAIVFTDYLYIPTHQAIIANDITMVYFMTSIMYISIDNEYNILLD